MREDFFDRLPLGATITDWASNTFFLTIYQKLVETLVCDPFPLSHLRGIPLPRRG